jgi:hypothetical protein
VADADHFGASMIVVEEQGIFAIAAWKSTGEAGAVVLHPAPIILAALGFEITQLLI